MENLTKEEFLSSQELLSLILGMKDLELQKTKVQVIELQLEQLRKDLKYRYFLGEKDQIDTSSGKIIRNCQE